tara:strand:+ start:200 stop:337 length:138 start_codon:yes stop_codon:yes gene_type:complete
MSSMNYSPGMSIDLIDYSEMIGLLSLEKEKATKKHSMISHTKHVG